MIILDTSILVDVDQYVFDDSAGTFGASILSRAELELGVCAAPNPQEMALRFRRLHQLDQVFVWLEFDIECTRSFGVLAAEARATGANIRSTDALIVAQAHRYGAAVMTVNLAGFTPFKHVIKIVEPRRR